MNIPRKVYRAELPYMGGKRGIAYELLLAMRQRHPDAKYFFDMFGGGGAMSMMALQFGFKVHYNEFCLYPYTVIKHVWENGFPEEWWNWVTREDFDHALEGTDPRSCMIRYVWSFGNSGKSYLFGKEKEESKRLCHQIVVYRDKAALDAFNEAYESGFRLPRGESVTARAANWRSQVNTVLKDGAKRGQQLERLERISLLQQVKQLEQVERVMDCLTFSNGSYEDVVLDTPPDETVVYCDPPYRNTAGYVSSEDGKEGTFSTQFFDKWVTASKYPVYISEYSAPFQTVFSIQKRETLGGAKSGKSHQKTERLYWNGVKAGMKEPSNA